MAYGNGSSYVGPVLKGLGWFGEVTERYGLCGIQDLHLLHFVMLFL